MSHNSFGHLFRVTTWGESHGPAIGCVIDGCPSKIKFSLSEIQTYLDQRKPGQSKYTTMRKEPDEVKVLSGVLEEGEFLITTGTPIAMMIENKDHRSKDYTDIAQVYRPSHADYTYEKKYGLRDFRGGGRSSARETAMRVAAGAIARKIIKDVKIRGAVVAIGPHEIDYNRWDWEERDKNPFFTTDKEMVPTFASYLEKIRKEGSSTGALIEIRAENVPVGLGAPIYGKLDQDIAGLIMSINAVKSVEIGAGAAVSTMRGEENADSFYSNEKGKICFQSNNAGGILGGISTGEPIIVRFAVKPTPSILKALPTVDKMGRNLVLGTKGRHDPCVGIRAVAVGEAMVACVLADHYLRHRGQQGS